MVWPIIGAESYVGETGKSMKAEEVSVQGGEGREVRFAGDRVLRPGAPLLRVLCARVGFHSHVNLGMRLPHTSTYGYSRCSMRGNGMGTRRFSRPQIQATARSMPMPKPECGTLPYLRRSRYHLKASSGRLCS